MRDYRSARLKEAGSGEALEERMTKRCYRARPTVGLAQATFVAPKSFGASRARPQPDHRVRACRH